MADGPYPAIELYWYESVDPTVGAGIPAPLKQILIRTDVPSVYYKSGLLDTDWTLIGDVGGGGGGVAISAGTQSVATGTVSFQDANGISWGMAASKTVTASFNAIKSISGGTTNMTGPGVSFLNGSGVSWGITGNTITASVAAQSVQPAIASISGGTTNMTGPGVSFLDGSGVSWGITGNTITASVGAVGGISHSQWNPGLLAVLTISDIGNGTLGIAPYQLDNAVVFSGLNLPNYASFATNSTGTASVTWGMGIYTRNVSTLSLLHSTTFSTALDYAGTNNSSIFFGLRLMTAPWTSTITRGDYWIGIYRSSVTSSQDIVNFGLMVATQQTNAYQGIFGQTLVGSNQLYLGQGVYTSVLANTALPPSIPFASIRNNLAQALRSPIFWFGAATA